MDCFGGGSGGAYLDVVGTTEYGTQPYAYTGNYGQCYLIAQIWSNTSNATFSFTDVQAAVVPALGAILLGGIGVGLVGWLKCAISSIFNAKNQFAINFIG